VGDIWVIERWWGEVWETIIWSIDREDTTLEDCIVWMDKNEFIMYDIHEFRLRNKITGETIPAALFA